MPIVKDDFMKFDEIVKKGISKETLVDAIATNKIRAYIMHPVLKKKMPFHVTKVLEDGQLEGRFLDD